MSRMKPEAVADVLNDANTHREAWMHLFDLAKQQFSENYNKEHIEHERSALLRLLNAVDKLGWMTAVTHNDGSKEVFFKPKGGEVVSGAGADWADAVYAAQDVLVEEIEKGEGK